MERNKPMLEGLQLEKDKLNKDIRAPDLNFRPNPVHLTIMKEAKKNGGIYDRRIAIQKIKDSDNAEKLKNQMITWNEVNINTLINAGYLKRKDDYTFISNPLAYDIRRADFKPGKNHIKLLMKNTNGIIKSLELKNEFKDKREVEQKRQKNIIDGMIKKLYQNEYLERIGKGEYKITNKGYKLLNEAPNNLPFKRDCKVMQSKKGFSVTAFDRFIKEVSKDGKINEELLNKHSRAESIKKRINTFKINGLILEDGSITEECLKLLDRKLELSNNLLTIDSLTKEQLQLVKDIRIFLNLSKKQILKYLYDNNEKLAEIDLNFMIQKKILKKDADLGIYIMDKVGINLSNDLFPNAVKYYTKLFSRKEEVEHDMLVYSAYQTWLKKVISKGGKVIDIKNDRQLRSDDSKKYGHMVGAYPDLRVYYKMPNSDKIFKYDIEVDCGYDGKTIKTKIHGLIGTASNANLGWYCKTLYQAAKVANILTRDTTRASRMNVARKMTVYYMDKDGNLQTVKHRHWDK